MKRFDSAGMVVNGDLGGIDLRPIPKRLSTSQETYSMEVLFVLPSLLDPLQHFVGLSKIACPLFSRSRTAPWTEYF